jgi:hypothetical protein
MNSARAARRALNLQWFGEVAYAILRKDYCKDLDAPHYDRIYLTAPDDDVAVGNAVAAVDAANDDAKKRWWRNKWRTLSQQRSKRTKLTVLCCPRSMERTRQSASECSGLAMPTNSGFSE